MWAWISRGLLEEVAALEECLPHLQIRSSDHRKEGCIEMGRKLEDQEENSSILSFHFKANYLSKLIFCTCTWDIWLTVVLSDSFICWLLGTTVWCLKNCTDFLMMLCNLCSITFLFFHVLIYNRVLIYCYLKKKKPHIAYQCLMLAVISVCACSWCVCILHTLHGSTRLCKEQSWHSFYLRSFILKLNNVMKTIEIRGLFVRVPLKWTNLPWNRQSFHPLSLRHDALSDCAVSNYNYLNFTVRYFPISLFMTWSNCNYIFHFCYCRHFGWCCALLRAWDEKCCKSYNILVLFSRVLGG